MKESVYKSYNELPLFINRAAETMANAIIAALSEFPTGAAKSITCSASSIPKAKTFPEFPLPP